MPDLPSHFGPYEVISQLGAGGMGEVYLARDRRLQRNVAIKILREASALDPDRQRRFAQEAVAASALNHPNIITVYDVGVEGQTPYLVSELIEGHSLRVEMNRGRLPLKRIIEITHQIAEGPRGRPRSRHRPSRPQTRERDGHTRRTREDCRLRPGQAAVRRGLASMDCRRRRKRQQDSSSARCPT